MTKRYATPQEEFWAGEFGTVVYHRATDFPMDDIAWFPLRKQ